MTQRTFCANAALFARARKVQSEMLNRVTVDFGGQYKTVEWDGK